MHVPRFELKQRKGFTIVELLVVIVVIGILTTIVIVSYGAWQTSTRTAQVKSDLTSAASAMEAARNFGSGYPSSLPSSITPSSGVTLTLTATAATSYCIDGGSTVDSSIQYYTDSLTGSKGPQTGTCTGRTNLPTPGVPTGIAAVGTVDTQTAFTFTPADAYALSFTAQCSTDQAFVGGLVTGTGLNSPVAVTGLATATTYYCRVNASNNTGVSAWSAAVTLTTQLSPPPTGILALTATTTQVNYAFLTVSGAASYNVQRATNSAFTTGVATNSQTINTGSFSGLAVNTIYYFRVQSVDSSGTGGPYNGNSPYGGLATATTQTLTLLIIAGGGGGSIPSGSGGGGGAGGVITTSSQIVSGTGANAVVVGAGGAQGVNGSNSSIFSLTAIGGGFGSVGNPSNGGSGGGAGRAASTTSTVGLGTSGQGFNGGTSGYSSGQYPSAGGGGAGGVGASVASASPGNSGAGGPGITSSISGSARLYAGGGGAGGDYGCSRNLGPGAGGTGGGGAGGNSVNGNGGSGTANTGGGGGGATQLSNCSTSGVGGTGGSGIVVISYPTGSMTTSGGTVTTSGGNTIVTFNSSGTFTIVSIP